MRYFAVFLFSLFSLLAKAQDQKAGTVSGTIIVDDTREPVSGVNIININKVKGTTTDAKGNFTIEAVANDTLHISYIGFQSIKVRVTNDWIKFNTVAKIPITERAYTLEEVIIDRYHLTGYLPIDSKLIPIKESYRYNIAGLSQGYEGGQHSPNAFKRVLSTMMNPADLLNSMFGKKGNEMRRLREMKKDDTVRNALASKFDRETLAALLGVTKNDIADILEHCNYSTDFINTANDLQIMDAISGCYEDYKVMHRSK